MNMKAMQVLHEKLQIDNGNIESVVGDLAVVSFGNNFKIYKATNFKSVEISIVYDALNTSDLMFCKKVIENQELKRELQIAKKCFNVNNFTELELLAMEFIDANISFTGEMLDESYNETLNGLTTSEAVKVIYDAYCVIS